MARLRAVAAKVRLYVLVEGLAWVVGFVLLAASIQLLIDYGARGVRWSMRAVMLGLIIGGSLVVLWRRVAAPLRRRVSTSDVANLIERRYPQLSSILISAVRFSAGETGPADSNSPALVASVIRRAGPIVESLDFNAVVDSHRARRAGFFLLSALMLVTVAALAMPEVMGLWLTRNVLLQEVEWPKRTRLVVDLDGEELVGARGDDLIVEAHAIGVQPREVRITFETESGKRGREVMVTVGRQGSYRYRYTFRSAQEDFTFYLEGGDDRTDVFHARLLDRPHVTMTEMHVTPPAYTQLKPYTLGDGQRSAQVLPGANVEIRVETNKPVTMATLMAGRDVVAEAIHEEDRLIVTVSPRETHTYHFALIDEVNLENRRPVRFSLRVISDDSPRVRLKLVDVGDMITPQAILPIEVEFADTYGLATADLVYRVSREGAGDSLIELSGFRAGMKSFSTSVSWPVSAEALAAGEMLTLLARASDFDSVSGPNDAQSPETTLRVVTKEELLAELARREQEYRMDFERLVDSQEQVRGDLLTVLGRFRERETYEALPADLTPIERRQRNVAGSVNVIRQQFEQILAELRVNQLDTSDERERLGERIVKPLTQLAKRDLVVAADSIRRWSREASGDSAKQIDPLQVALLSQMRVVLDSMIEWEGYQEVVGLLRDIIRLQQELRTETRKKLEDRAGDLFDD